MKIGYDAKRLFTNFTGLGNYSRNLVSHYHQSYPEDELSLFTPGIKKDDRTSSFLENSAYNIIQPGGINPLWRSMDMVKDIRTSGIEVYHGLSHELPIGVSKLAIRKVVTIHDLIFKYYPQDYAWIDTQIYDWKWKHSCLMADHIIAISEQTKSDLIHYYNILPDKIKVIYQGADPIFSGTVSTEEVEAVKKKYSLPDVYNIYVGSIISRKNLLSIIQAMVLTKPSERLPLVIIGQGKDYKKKVIEEALRGGIGHLLVWLGSPAFIDFPKIYKGARMMIYPSMHEGFGLPVIEAMQVGIPVITSNQSSLKEAGGDSAALINPGDPTALAEVMTRIAQNTALRVGMIARGYEHLTKFDPVNLIKQTHSLYRGI